MFAGSIIEALLLWTISTPENEGRKQDAYDRARHTKKLTKQLPIDDLTARAWDLHSYLEIARELEEITESTANDCRRAKFYRNLIHPAAAMREQVENTRGNAHVALGAAFNTIDDLDAGHRASVNEDHQHH